MRVVGEGVEGREEREENVEVVNLSAKRNGSEYQDFISSEDTTDEGWVIVDISKLVLK